MKSHGLIALAAALLIGGCTTTGLAPGGPGNAELAKEASAGPLSVANAFVITDNDAAFQSKLKLINEAKTSLDLVYYIYDDDYSSAALSEVLIAAAQSMPEVAAIGMQVKGPSGGEVWGRDC